MQPYDYSHRQGIEEITWDRFAELSRLLAEQLAGRGVQAVVGIARAGLFPATAVACALRCDLHPVRVTRRSADLVVYTHPVWKGDLSAEVAGKAVAIVDEMADTGETLALVADRARALGAAHVVTAALVRHSWAQPVPDVTALVSDALVIFPWDRWVLDAGQWRLHPELADALRKQGVPRRRCERPSSVRGLKRPFVQFAQFGATPEGGRRGHIARTSNDGCEPPGTRPGPY